MIKSYILKEWSFKKVFFDIFSVTSFVIVWNWLNYWNNFYGPDGAFELIISTNQIQAHSSQSEAQDWLGDFSVPDLEWVCSRIYKVVPILLLNPILKGLPLEQLQSHDNYALYRLHFNLTQLDFSSPGGVREPRE